MSFENVLLREVFRSVDHLYGSGNWDEGRYGKNRKNLIADGLAKVNAALKPTHLALGIRSNELERVEQLLQEHGKGLEELYRHFEDVGSRELLVQGFLFPPTRAPSGQTASEHRGILEIERKGPFTDLPDPSPALLRMGSADD